MADEQSNTDAQTRWVNRMAIAVVGAAVAGVLVVAVASGGSGGDDSRAAVATRSAAATSATTTTRPRPTSTRPSTAVPTTTVPVPPTTTTEFVPPVFYYEVIGDGVRGASVTYSVGSNFDIQQDTAVKLPWRKEVAPGQIMTISAQGNGGGGTITCRILRGDEVLSSITSSGPYAIATCTRS